MDNYNLFGDIYPIYKIKKPIRLIEMFAGIGSQYQALKNIGANVEHHKIVEWQVNSIQAYNDIHIGDTTDYAQGKTKEELVSFLLAKGVSIDYNKPVEEKQLQRKPIEWLSRVYNNIIATKNIVNIMNVRGSDLEIKETDKYEYILTYSFPCQDLSLAGKGNGMTKGGGTRSGLLWEIERILNEIKTSGGELPQVLLMENVPEAVGSKNWGDFSLWEEYLTSLGYFNYYKIMNSKDFGIPQNRERVFMVSVFGGYTYEFPKEQLLTLRLKDMLEAKVDEKYYLTNDKIQAISQWKAQQDPLENMENIDKSGISPTLTARGAGEEHSGMVLVKENPNVVIVGNYSPSNHNATNIVSPNGISPIVMENHGSVTAVIVKESMFKSKDKRLPEMLDKIDYKTEEPQALDLYNRTVHSVMPTLTLPNHNSSAIVVAGQFQPKDRFYNKNGGTREEQFETRSDELANCVLTHDKKNMVGETKEYANYITWLDDKGRINTQDHRAYFEDRLSGVVPAMERGVPNVINKELRIRKLTPRECYRLMGFSDEAFDKAQANQSNSALYHQAGDSIVVNVLMAIFTEML
jgi:DNA (cytosine-5)-methyltransferase 1